MFKSLFDKAARYKRNLTTLDNQPIGKAALIIIIFLDIFILTSIFDGLSDHTRQLTTPYEYIPHACRDIVADTNWNETNRLEKLAGIVGQYHSSYYQWDADKARQDLHAICQPFERALRSIRGDKTLANNLERMRKLEQEIAQLRAQSERTKGAYDTSLLETIAKQRQGQANVDAIKEEIDTKTAEINSLARERQQVEAVLVQDNKIQEFFGLIAGVTTDTRDQLRKELRSLNFWYPVKRLGMEMLFLLPLLVVFYFWNTKSIAANRPFQTLVSSHLLIIAVVPVFFKLIELVYDIIPKKFLQHLIELLESLKLVALWHYLLMGVVILAALALIYFFQKKLFSHERLMLRRIGKGLCQNCNHKLPAGSPACPNCGFVQFKPCPHCQKPTYVHGKYCKECGQAIE